MERKLEIDIDRAFGDREALELHQLRLMEWMATTGRKRFGNEPRAADDQSPPPPVWKLTQGVKRYAWQDDCITKWLEQGGRGTVKVVTGGGKTLLALSIAERLQNTLESELRVAVVVPTIVLMHQWHAMILERGNIPQHAIGRLGGGYDEDFSPDRRILITVLASATKQLPKLVKKAGVGKRLMLIADECHRAGAKEMSNVFKTERRWSLGLSATPEREDAIDSDYDKSVVGKEVGPIVCEYNLADAVRDDLVPKFVINHYGLPMSPAERSRYEALSRSITDAMSQLRAQRDADGDFFAWARSVATRNKGELGDIARRFVSETSKRRDLLNHLQSRHQAVEALLQQEFAVNKDARVILFHESINEVMNLFLRLRALKLDVIMEHSELPDSYREKGLDHFRTGLAKIIVSARSLIEGFNVPAVDVAIIVASSNSVRQRIQSLGRVLRRHRGPDGEEKTSCIHVLYAADSIEEQIYGKLDWGQTTGLDRNRYFLWDGAGQTVAQVGAPRTPLPGELLIDPQKLDIGSTYPGEYEGQELTCDTRGNICTLAGIYASDTGELAELVVRAKGCGGRFRITPKRQFVLVRVPAGEEWETVFVTQLVKPLQLKEATTGASVDEALRWQMGAKPGDLYPFGGLKLNETDLQFKQKAGGVISKRVRGGEVFARQAGKSHDAPKGANASSLVAALQQLRTAGKKIGRISVNVAQHALYRENGQLYFIAPVPGGLEFPAE